MSEAKCPGAANLEPLDAAPNSLHLPLVQSVWLFAPFSQTFDLGSFKFQSFEMLLPWHRFILELLLKTKKKKTGTSSVLVGGWRKAALRGSAKSWVRVSSRSRLRAVKVADTPPHPPKKPTGTRESTLQRTLVLGFPVFQTVPVQECIPVTIIPSEIISVEYNDSLRGRGEDAPCRAWPYLREFLPSPSFTKLESCATDAQHKTWGLNTRKSTMVLCYSLWLWAHWMARRPQFSFVDILPTCLLASAGPTFWTFPRGAGNQE